MGMIDNPENRFWRTSNRPQEGNLIFALVHNDPGLPSRDDVLVGNMDNPELAEHVVEIHNLVLKKFGRHYKRGLELDD